MDEDTQKALLAMATAHNKLMAAFIGLSARCAAGEELILQLSQSFAPSGKEGHSLRDLIDQKTGKFLSEALLQIEDEQLAGFVRDEIEKFRRPSGL